MTESLSRPNIVKSEPSHPIPKPQTLERTTKGTVPRLIKEGGNNPDKILHLLADNNKETTTQDWNFARLANQALKSSKEVWKDIPPQEANRQWERTMREWWNRLPKNQKQDVQAILGQLGIQPLLRVYENGKRPEPEYDWNNQIKTVLYPEGKPDIASFLQAVIKAKAQSGIDIGAARQLAGIFGEEVKTELFGGKFTRADQWRNDLQRSIDAVQKAFEAGKIDAAKKDRLIAKAKARSENPERITNGIVLDPQFTKEQQSRINKVLEALPTGLLKQVSRINFKPESTHADMDIRKGLNLGQDTINIYSHSFRYGEDEFARKLIHEIGGHGLTHMVKDMDKNQHDALMNYWNQLLINNPGLIYKDDYSNEIARGENAHYNKYGKDRLMEFARNEFMANRMSEILFYQAFDRQTPSHRMANNPFTAEEEAIMRQACQHTLDTWQQAYDNYEARKANTPKIVQMFQQAFNPGLAQAA